MNLLSNKITDEYQKDVEEKLTDRLAHMTARDVVDKKFNGNVFNALVDTIKLLWEEQAKNQKKNKKALRLLVTGTCECNRMFMWNSIEHKNNMCNGCMKPLEENPK